ncbi:hypothetical protein PoB_007353000 [Plakobranchus ocellatus]|uniref:Uncharacterized protein n=1 Tax=Plakobranchus ocellatus TaxID=259542 RepID=A0AAV4DSM3_9GAST|nr:hypothetical protein PoB_007353000 [Plakobranchus ocellatus]
MVSTPSVSGSRPCTNLIPSKTSYPRRVPHNPLWDRISVPLADTRVIKLALKSAGSLPIGLETNKYVNGH